MRRLPLLAFVGLLVVGCGTNSQSSTSDDLKTPQEMASSAKKDDTKAVAAAWPTNIKIHKNKEGKVACPVMGTLIESPDKAVGYQDYNGVRYYFCCDMCPPKFKENPSLYADRADKGPKQPD